MRALGLLVLVLGLPISGLAAGELTQDVTPIVPTVEQRVEVLNPGTAQRVEVVDAQGLQDVTGNATDSVGTRGAKTVGKVVLTIVGAAVSCGLMVVSLLFI